MRLFLPILLLFVSDSKCAGAGTRMRYNSIGECASKTIKERIPQAKVTSADHCKKHGEAFTVVGLSWDCVFFMAYVHDLMADLYKTQSNSTITVAPELEGACGNFKSFLMYTQRRRELLAVVVTQDGNRLRVQSAITGRLLNLTNEALYMEVDIFDRLQHFHTQPFPKGYSFVRLFNNDYKVYVATRNYYHVKIFELVLDVTNENSLHVYLKAHGIEFDNLMVEPTDDIMVAPVSKIDASEDIDNAVEERFLLEEEDEEDLPPFFPKVEDIDLKNVQGFAAHKREYGGLHMMQNGRSFIIPMVSLLNNHFRGLRLHGSYSEQVWKEKEDRFYLVIHPCMIPMHHGLVYTRKLNRWKQGHFIPPSTESLAMWISSTRFFNPANTHRAMAYPHVRVIAGKHYRSNPYLKVIALCLGIALAMSLVVALLYWRMYRRNKRL